MSRTRHEQLAHRQRQLLRQSAALRHDLGLHGQALRAPLALLDQGLSGVQWLREHPLWSSAAVLLFSAWRPKRVMGWASRLWWGWSLFKKTRRWLSPY